MRTADAIQRDFESNGFAVFDGVLDEPTLGLLEQTLGAWLDRQVADWGGAVPMHDFKREFYEAWQDAGRPEFRRAPYTNLVQPAMFAFLRSPAMLRLAASVLQTQEISVHGIFNARPMLPCAPATPWHQDAQYWPGHGEPDPELARTRRVVTIWLPLQDLDPLLGGLEVASLPATQAQLFTDQYIDAQTKLLKLPPAFMASLRGEVPILARGGCIVFSQLNCHRGTPNRSDRIRWSFDVRYECTDGATLSGRRYGFVASSPSGRHREDTFETWSDRVKAECAHPNLKKPRPDADTLKAMDVERARTTVSTYLDEVEGVVRAISRAQVEDVVDCLYACWKRASTAYIIGNGGSASTASHMMNDLSKLTAFPGVPRFRAVALTDNMPLITAIGNDLEYADVFLEQVRNLLKPDDVLISISGSGNSENIIRAARYAREIGAEVIGLCGQPGSRLCEAADTVVTVQAPSICQQEDAHLILNHTIALALRDRIGRSSEPTSV